MSTFEGRSFTLKNATFNKVGAPALKGGLPGAYTKEEGIYSFFEICEKTNIQNWTKAWDKNQQSAYATHNDQWVGYDNERSIALKVHWALTVMSLGGTMLWTLDFDDYSGQFCDRGQFPLANAIKSVFNEYETEPVSAYIEPQMNVITDHEFDTVVIETTTMTSRTTRVVNTTIKTFYLPNIKDLNDLNTEEQFQLNEVMYEILNAPLVAPSDDHVRNNVTNRTEVLKASDSNADNNSGKPLIFITNLNFLTWLISSLFCLIFV